ncbi:MAG TPA: disulfide bond formation protein B [Steroidobacteraceae bacterium]
MQSGPGRRALNLIGFAVCAALLAYAYHVQYQLRIEPCPLCIFQRIGIALLGLILLLAGLHLPRRFGAHVYSALLAVASLATAGVAIRHIWIQHLPEGAVPSCGASLQFLLKIFSLTEVITKVLTGSGECHQINWSMLGLSMPAWVLLFAVGLGALGVYANSYAKR